MTIRGKRKALNNDPGAQITAIARFFNGKIPVKPIPRRFPGAAWQEVEVYHIAKLIRGKLCRSTSKLRPTTVGVYKDALTACGYLANTYHRRVSLPDLDAAKLGPVFVPTLEESQTGIICWIQDWKQIKQPDTATWQYCVVSPEGIKSGTTYGKPKPVDGYHGPLIRVFGGFSCKELLKRAFRLNIHDNELMEAFGKVVVVPKVLAVKENGETPDLVPPNSISK